MAEATAEDFEETLEARSKELAMEAANRWFSESNERLLQGGDEHDYDVFPVVQSAQPPQWDAREQAAVMSWPHRASAFFAHGTTSHEIEGDPLLVFEYEEMRGEEFADTGKTWEEVFDDFPTVFLPRVEVDGIPRIPFDVEGKRTAARWLQEQSR